MDPMYVPRVHRGQVYLYTTPDVIKVSWHSLILKKEPIFRGLIGIGFKLTAPIWADIICFNLIWNCVSLIKGITAYIFNLGTDGFLT